MKTRTMKNAMLLFMLLLAGTVMYAQPPRGKPVPGTRMMSPAAPRRAMMQEKLNITDEQKDQMKQLRLDMMKEMLPLRNEMGVLKAEYRQLMGAEKTDEKSLNANIDKQTALMNKMKKARSQYAMKMRSILTEEQWLMIQSHRSRSGKGGMKGHRAGFSGPGAGPCGMAATGRRGYGAHRMGPGMMMPAGDNDQ